MHKQAEAGVRNLSEDGVKQLILAYRADQNGAVVKDFKFRPGFIYTSCRAISARINQNFDAWPSEELVKSYRTFLGKPCFVNHNNFDPEKARGRVIAARYVDAGNADKYIEVVQEIDAQRFPKLAHELRTGGLDGVSMGVEAGFTKCSICDNKATDTADMCNHVKFHKGEHLYSKKTGKKELCYENCYKLGFFELSYVFDPADETAVVSKVLVANKTAKHFPDFFELGRQSAQSGGPSEPHQHHEVSRATRHLDQHGPEVREAHEQYRRGYDAGMREGMPKYKPPPKQDVGLGGYPGGYQWHPKKQRAASKGGSDRSTTGYRFLYGSEPPSSSIHHAHDFAYGKPEAPTPVDTLRPDDVDLLANDDEEMKIKHFAHEVDRPFKHYVSSPEELQDPDLEPSIDTVNEEMGRMTQAQRLRHYAADEDEDYGEDDSTPEESDGGGESEEAPPDFGGGEEDFEGGGEEAAPDVAEDLSGGEEDVVVDFLYFCESNGVDPSPEAVDAYAQASGLPPDDPMYQGLQQFVAEFFGGGMEEEAPPEEAPVGEPAGGGFDANDMGQGPPVALARKRGKPMGRSTLAERGRVASRGQRRHFQSADNGYTDGGPYGRNDEGEQENVFITDVPSPESVETGGDGQISNTENNLVARVVRGTEQLKRDTAALQRFRAAKRRYAEELPGMGAEPRGGLGGGMGAEPRGPVSSGMQGGKPQGPMSLGDMLGLPNLPPAGSAAKHGSYRHAADGGLPDATTVNPDLSGTTDGNDLKGDFESLQPEKVETQPKDASLHAFAAFDNWLRQTTGRTAAQHNAAFIRRQAARWANAQGIPIAAMFPTLEFVLRQARKAERSPQMYRTADEKLDVAAPEGRIDVEKPVSDITDEVAQSSQFDLGDFGSNAGDNVADPDLETGSQIWAPGEGSKTSKKADAVAAVRCAEAYITAGLTPPEEKWKLIASFQTMRHATVVDRTRLLEAVIQANQAQRRFVASQRGTAPRNALPPGFASGGMARTAATQRMAANDPSFDCTLYV